MAYLVWMFMWMVLMVEACFLGSPVIGHWLVIGVNPFQDLYGWKTVLGFILSFAILVWWMGRSQRFVWGKR